MILLNEGLSKLVKKEITKNYKEAKNGKADAQRFLGVMYHNGHSVEKNMEIALKWFTKAANQGNAAAQNDLGTMYANDDGIEQNTEVALK